MTCEKEGMSAVPGKGNPKPANEAGEPPKSYEERYRRLLDANDSLACSYIEMRKEVNDLTDENRRLKAACANNNAKMEDLESYEERYRRLYIEMRKEVNDGVLSRGRDEKIWREKKGSEVVVDANKDLCPTCREKMEVTSE